LLQAWDVPVREADNKPRTAPTATIVMILVLAAGYLLLLNGGARYGIRGINRA
jgi:hypothetical protein